MKKLFSVIISIFIGYSISAQDMVDALRFSETFSGGTARSTAMGGAFGSLGADFGSATQNPAGFGFYRMSEFTLTPSMYHNTTKSEYLGNNTKDSKFNGNFNNFSIVLAHKSRRDKGLAGMSIGLGFNRVNDYNGNTTIEGTNAQSSLADHYVQTANHYGNLDPFSDGLFYDAYLLNYDSISGNFYKEASMSLPAIQRKVISTTGRLNDWNLALGFNISNFLYYGATFNFMPLDYSENSYYSEYNAAIPNSQYFSQYENTSTSGTGYAGKFGIIVVPAPFIHVGFAYHTPVNYRLHYEYQTNMVSQYVNGVVFPYQYEDGLHNDYTLITPYKLVGSLGFVFGKFGILSADVEYIDYSSTHLKNGGGGDNFSDVNDAIKQVYRSTFNVKTGAEVRLFSMLYVRGGFGYYGSPYKPEDPGTNIPAINKDAYHLNYSAGIGLRQKQFYIDFAWSYFKQKEKYILYSWADLPTDPTGNTIYSYTSNQTKSITNFITTFGFRF